MAQIRERGYLVLGRDRHVEQFETLVVFLTCILPSAAIRQIEPGARVNLADRWGLSASALVEVHSRRGDAHVIPSPSEADSLGGFPRG